MVNSDWIEGHSITWKGNYLGYEAYQKGAVLICQPKALIKYSTFDPHFGYEDKAVNYVHVTYVLKQKDHGVDITFISDNFGDDQKRYEDTKNGWDTIVIPAFMKVFES